MLNARMAPLAAVLLFAAAASACSTPPAKSWRQPPRNPGPVAAPAPAAVPMAQPVAVDPGEGSSRRKLPKGPPTYKYGAKFEPPDGRILHGMGNWPEGNKNYLAALDDARLEPAAATFFIASGDWPRPWERQVEQMRKALDAEAAQGRMLHVGIELWGLDSVTRKRVAIDVDVANGSKFDGHIRDLAKTIADVGVPAFVRVGSEFSGEWTGYSPDAYPKAFRRVVEIFREEKADNVAFVWCWEVACPGDFDEKDQGQWRWYPGDDVVDWFGIDIYNQGAFASGSGRGAGTPMATNTQRFLEMAEQHDKPVVVGESGAVTVGITADEKDGQQDWATWFEPYFRFMADHPGIKAFFYDNSDWKKNNSARRNGWQDGDIDHNEYIAKHYAKEMRDPMYLHKSELHLLKDWPKDLKVPVAPPPPSKPGSDGAR
jgi:hypothetical protein